MIETAKQIVDKLKSRNETIAIAESLTGGAISSALTDVPGTSHVLIGAIVAYSTDIKIRELGVSPESISKFGVVSQEGVLQMADGIRSKFGSDWSIATTGVAGPGTSHGVAAGTVWIAILGPNTRESLLLSLAGDRDDVRRGAVESALATLARILGL